MRILRYIGRRLIFFVPQVVGIVLMSFFLIKMIPGDPAILMLGPLASEASLQKLRAELGLDQPLMTQLWIYLKNLARGDLGTSWQTTRPVTEDLLLRFPATLELITYGLLVALVVGVTLGVLAGSQKSGFARKIADLYGLAAGALPDFWVALVLIFIFYTVFSWAPPPTGRLDLAILPPPTVTGFYTIDSLLAGDFQAFRSAVAHLVLPVLTLAIINAGPILKMTRGTMERMMNSEFSRYGELCGLPRWTIVREAFRNSLPSVVTIVSVLYGYLVGGAVLVEVVFSWGGAGQYAIQGVLNSDLNPVLGFVVLSAIFSLVVYLVVDLIYLAIDPRIGRE